MADSKKKTEAPPKRAPTLYLIVVHHMAKGSLLLLTAVGIFALNRSGHDLGGVFDQLLRWLHLDPAQKFFADIGDQLDKVTPANMRVAEMGSLLYGLLMFGAGLGLAFRAHWAVWLAIGEAAFLRRPGAACRWTWWRSLRLRTKLPTSSQRLASRWAGSRRSESLSRPVVAEQAATRSCAISKSLLTVWNFRFTRRPGNGSTPLRCRQAGFPPVPRRCPH